MTYQQSKYQSAADQFLARGKDETQLDFDVRKMGTVEIADALDCGVWHAAYLWDKRNIVRSRCTLCGGTMLSREMEAHSLCTARRNKGVQDLPVLNYNPKCGCNWELCEG